MKLNSLYKHRDQVLLESYLNGLSKKLFGKKLLMEGKRVVVTTEIIDDDDVKITKEAKEEFIEKAKEIGNFDDSEWIGHIVNGLKQAGVQGMGHIAEDDKPVSNKDVRQLISLLVNLISK